MDLNLISPSQRSNASFSGSDITHTDLTDASFGSQFKSSFKDTISMAMQKVLADQKTKEEAGVNSASKTMAGKTAAISLSESDSILQKMFDLLRDKDVLSSLKLTDEQKKTLETLEKKYVELSTKQAEYKNTLQEVLSTQMNLVVVDQRLSQKLKDQYNDTSAKQDKEKWGVFDEINTLLKPEQVTGFIRGLKSALTDDENKALFKHEQEVAVKS